MVEFPLAYRRGELEVTLKNYTEEGELALAHPTRDAESSVLVASERLEWLDDGEFKVLRVRRPGVGKNLGKALFKKLPSGIYRVVAQVLTGEVECVLEGGEFKKQVRLKTEKKEQTIEISGRGPRKKLVFEPSPLKWIVNRSGEIVVKVKEYQLDGRLISATGKEVVLEGKAACEDTDPIEKRMTTGSSGSVTFSGLLTGEYRISAKLKGLEEENRRVVIRETERSVSLKITGKDRNEVTLRPPEPKISRRGEILVHLKTQNKKGREVNAQGFQVCLKGESIWFGERISRCQPTGWGASSGEALFDKLPTGRYEVSAIVFRAVPDPNDPSEYILVPEGVRATVEVSGLGERVEVLLRP